MFYLIHFFFPFPFPPLEQRDVYEFLGCIHGAGGLYIYLAPRRGAVMIMKTPLRMSCA